LTIFIIRAKVFPVFAFLQDTPFAPNKNGSDTAELFDADNASSMFNVAARASIYNDITWLW
jgi:hypothetical protein